MAKSARKVLTEQKTVRVANFKQITEDLGVLSYIENDVRFVDLFNIPSEAIMKTLEEVPTEKSVDAVIAPDSSTDKDGHPEVISAMTV